jgi:hypothetical protein
MSYPEYFIGRARDCGRSAVPVHVINDFLPEAAQNGAAAI